MVPFSLSQKDDGTVREKLDFKMRIPSTTFLTCTPITADEFGRLLATGELNAKAKISLQSISLTQVSE